MATPNSLSDCSRSSENDGGAARQIGVPYGTNAPFFAAAGVPTVVFGPGSIEQAHTAAEWISIDQLHTAVGVYAAVGRGETVHG